MTMTEPRFPVRITRGVPVVIAPDEIDITNAEALRAALLYAAARPGPALVVDMTRTRFCDSAGLHALIGAYKRAQAEGRRLNLAVTGTQVRRILALTALDRLIPVCTSLDQALAHPPAAPSRPPVNRAVSTRRAAARQIADLMVQTLPGSGHRIHGRQPDPRLLAQEADFLRMRACPSRPTRVRRGSPAMRARAPVCRQVA
jgi:anti-sigma B factor antagonist